MQLVNDEFAKGRAPPAVISPRKRPAFHHLRRPVHAFRLEARGWRRQRIKELHGEINEAQRKGDHALRDRLVDEKTRLSRSLHRASRQGANYGL